MNRISEESLCKIREGYVGRDDFVIRLIADIREAYAEADRKDAEIARLNSEIIAIEKEMSYACRDAYVAGQLEEQEQRP